MSNGCFPTRLGSFSISVTKTKSHKTCENTGAKVAANRLLYRWMVKTGFCQRDLGQTNKQQCHFNLLLISDLHGEIDSIQTTLKPLFTTHLQ